MDWPFSVFLAFVTFAEQKDNFPRKQIRGPLVVPLHIVLIFIYWKGKKNAVKRVWVTFKEDPASEQWQTTTSALLHLKQPSYSLQIPSIAPRIIVDSKAASFSFVAIAVFSQLLHPSTESSKRASGNAQKAIKWIFTNPSTQQQGPPLSQRSRTFWRASSPPSLVCISLIVTAVHTLRLNIR